MAPYPSSPPHAQLQKANKKHFETRRTVLWSLLLNHGAHWRRIRGPTEEGRRVFSSWKRGKMNKIWHILSVAAVLVSTRKHQQAVGEFMLNNCSSRKVTIVFCPSLWLSCGLILSTLNSVQNQIKFWKHMLLYSMSHRLSWYWADHLAAVLKIKQQRAKSLQCFSCVRGYRKRFMGQC